jgi:hypothetical protein
MSIERAKTDAIEKGTKKPTAEPKKIRFRRTRNNPGKSISSRPIKKNKKKTLEF